MKDEAYRALLELLRRLDAARISYSLRQAREEALMIDVRVPGERWEIEFVDYGDEVQIEVERFTSKGQIDNESALDDLFARFSDSEQVAVDEGTSSRA